MLVRVAKQPAYVWASTRCRQPAGIRRAERRRGPNNCPGARPGAPAVASCSSYCKQVRVPTWWYLRLASGLVQSHRTVAAQVPAGQRQACRGEEAGEADWPFGASSGTRGWSGGSGSSSQASARESSPAADSDECLPDGALALDGMCEKPGKFGS